MEPKDLERILKYLPEPTSVEVSLSGHFDYGGIVSQVGELIPSVRLRGIAPEVTFQLDSPTKQQIIDIFRHSYEVERALRQEREQRHTNIDETGKIIPYPKRVDLHKVRWRVDNAEIELTGYGLSFKVRYSRRKSRLISKIEEELAHVGHTIKIEVGN